MQVGVKPDPGDLPSSVREGSRYYPWRSNSLYGVDSSADGIPPLELYPKTSMRAIGCPLATELSQDRRSPGQALDQRAQELAVEAQLAALGEGLEVARLDLEELHLGYRDDRGGAARAVAREVRHLAEAVAFL